MTLKLRDDVKPDLIRLSVNITHDTADALEKLAANKGITKTEALRRSVERAKFIEDVIARGGKILVREPDGEVKELVFI